MNGMLTQEQIDGREAGWPRGSGVFIGGGRSPERSTNARMAELLDERTTMTAEGDD